MRTLSALSAVVRMALFALIVSPALARGKPLEGIPLVWKPTTQIGESGAVDLTSIGQVRILVRPLTDTRENPALIGENREKKIPKPVTTSDDVAAWCTSGPGEGDVGLKIDVLEAVQNLFKNDGFRAAMKRSGP